MKDVEQKVLYRADYELIEFDAEMYSEQKPKIIFEEYKIAKETPKGFFIQIPSIDMMKRFGYSEAKIKLKFVLKSPDGKRYAYLKKSDALRAFIYRKQRYEYILTNRLEVNQRLLDLAREFNDKFPEELIETQNEYFKTCPNCKKEPLNDDEEICDSCYWEQEKFNKCEGKGI